MKLAEVACSPDADSGVQVEKEAAMTDLDVQGDAAVNPMFDRIVMCAACDRERRSLMT